MFKSTCIGRVCIRAKRRDLKVPCIIFVVSLGTIVFVVSVFSVMSVVNEQPQHRQEMESSGHLGCSLTI